MVVGPWADAQIVREDKSHTSDAELVKLRDRISREKGKKKFEAIYNYLNHLHLKYGLRDYPESHELVEEARRLKEEYDNDPFLRVRYLIIQSWLHQPKVLTVPSKNKFKCDSIVNIILAFYDSAYSAGFSREDSLQYAHVLRYKAEIVSTYGHRDSVLKSLPYTYRSLRVFEAMEDSLNIVFNLASIGAIHFNIHNYDVAVHYTLEGIKLAKKHNPRLYISLHNNLGLIYMMQKNYSEAIKHFEFAVEEFLNYHKNGFVEKGGFEGTAQFMVNAAAAAMNIKDIPNLKRFHARLDSLLARYPSDYFQTYAWLFASAIAMFEGDGEKSRELRHRVDEFVPQSKAYRAAAMTFYVWAEEEHRMRRHRTAISGFRKAISYPEQLNKTYLEKIYRGLAEGYRALNDMDSAFYFLEKEIRLRDSIAELANEFRAMDLLNRYESAQLKASLQSAREENRRQRMESRWAWTIAATVGLGLAVVVILLISLRRSRSRLWILNSRLKKRNAIIDGQRREIQLQAYALQNALDAKERLDRFKENMIQLLVHDLKSPLNTALGFAEMSTDETTKKYVTSAGQKMLNLVLTLLDVSKFESDTLKPFCVNVNFYDLLTSAREQIVLELEIKNIKFDYVGPWVTVKADKQLIHRVLVNLLTNAVKYTPSGGRVEVKVEVADGRAFVSVSDTGPGIAPEHLPNIFERFVQHDAKNLGRTPSTGLGLHFCKLAVEAHGGKINVASQLGHGTTFTFDLTATEWHDAQSVTISTPVTSRTLGDADRAMLAPFAVKLQQMEIFETTRILSVLDQIPSGHSEIERWKTEVLNAVFVCNAEGYRQMLAMALNLKSSPVENILR